MQTGRRFGWASTVDARAFRPGPRRDYITGAVDQVGGAGVQDWGGDDQAGGASVQRRVAMIGVSGLAVPEASLKDGTARERTAHAATST